MRGKLKFTTALTVVMVLLLNIFLPTASVIAVGGYTLTFVVEDGTSHSIVVEDGHLKIDGGFVELRTDGSDSSTAIGTPSDANGNYTITVDDGTEAELNFGGNDFSLFVNGEKYNYGTKFNSDQTITVGDFVDNNNPQDPSNQNTVGVVFDSSTIEENVVTYNVENTDVTLTVVGTNITDGKIEIDRNSLDSVHFTIGDTFDAETMQVIVRGPDNYSSPLAVDNGVASLNGLNFPDGGLHISIEAIDNHGGNNTDEYEDITINVTFNNTQGEVILNNEFRTTEGASFSGTLTKAGYADSSKTNKIQINTSYGENAANKVTINDVQYNYDANGYIVDGASTYTIVVTGDSTIPTPKTIIWANPDYVPTDEADAEWISDFTISHGRAKAIAVYDDQNQLLDPSEYTNQESDEYGLKDGFGWVGIYPGSKVIFEFEPEYGYQLTDIKINDMPIENPTETPNQYEFTMIEGSGNIHFAANFEQKENTQAIGTDTAVTNMSYTLEDGALDSGTAKLSIDKVNEEDLTEDQKTSFAEAAGNNYEVSTYLDVDLTQVWYKGKDDSADVWTKDIYDLGDKKAEITVTLDEGITPDDVIILHELHTDDGTVTGYETVNITNKEKVNGVWVVTFETSKFSNFAVAAKKDTTPSTYDVTFNTNGGSSVEKQTIISGEKATEPATPTKEGYTFNGWYADATLSTQFDFNTPITEDITLYAKWQKVWTVTIDMNGHGGDNIVLDNVPDGTPIYYFIGMGQYSTENLQETIPDDNGYRAIGINLKKNYTSWREYNADLEKAALWNSEEKLIVDTDTTLYVAWAKMIDKIEFTVQAPIAGTETTTTCIDEEEDEYDWESQTNKPQVTVASGKGYKYGMTYNAEIRYTGYWENDDYDNYGPFIGTFVSGNTYYADLSFETEYGYIFKDNVTIEATGMTVDDSEQMGYGLTETLPYYNIAFTTHVTDFGSYAIVYGHLVAKEGYVILEGANQTIEAEEGEDLVVKANGSVNDFVELKVDGETVDSDNYSIESGSTIAKLKSSFLNTLSAGTHTLTFVYTDGEVSTNFKIAKANTEENTTTEETTSQKTTSNPKTGDNITKYITILTAGLIGLIMTKKIKGSKKSRKH